MQARHANVRITVSEALWMCALNRCSKLMNSLYNPAEIVVKLTRNDITYRLMLHYIIVITVYWLIINDGSYKNITDFTILLRTK